MPLEVFVERQPFGLPAADAPAADGLRLGVETGPALPPPARRSVDAQDYRPAFTETFAVRPLAAEEAARLDAATRGYLRLVAGRALDGRRLRAALAGLRGNALPNIGMPIASGDVAEVRAACAAWMAWVDELFSQPDRDEQAWQRDRMEYAFSFATRTSPDPFDEWTLDGRASTAAGRSTGTASTATARSTSAPRRPRPTPARCSHGPSLPAPVTLRGMPAPRFWEMEDALLDLGALQPGGTDLPQLLMIDTVSGYGNDWYVIGLDLPTGSLVTHPVARRHRHVRRRDAAAPERRPGDVVERRRGACSSWRCRSTRAPRAWR